MLEYVNSLSPQEAEDLKRVIRDLMRQSCIIETKYDTEKGAMKDNPRYGTCMRHREFLTDYFEIMGCTLVFDPQDRFFRLTGEGAAQERFGETATLMVLLMKLIYKEKILGQGLHSTMTTLGEVRRYGMETGILTRKLTEREISEALSLMKTHQMIELPCALGDVEDQTPIYLYNTINVFLSGASAARLYEQFKGEGVSQGQLDWEKKEGEEDADERQ